MCDSDNNQGFIVDTSMTRRAVVLTLSSVAAVAALPSAAFASDVTETDVMITTPDGKADAVLFHPAGSRSWPAVLVLGLSACGESPAASAEQGTIEQAFFVPPDRFVPAPELAAAVRKAGYPCRTVTALGQLERNGAPLDNYKLECPGHSYLLTWLEGGSRIKPRLDDLLN